MSTETDFATRLRDRRSPFASRLVTFSAIALALHVITLGAANQLYPYLMPENDRSDNPIVLTIMEPLEPKEDEPEEEERNKDLEGQLVEISPPEEEVEPEDADYMSDYNMEVEEETRPEKVDVNPEVLARVFSEESKMEQEDLIDLNVDKPSTGAQVGNDRFDPDRDGTLAALPSPWAMTNKDGIQDPVPSAHMASQRSGAPQNDLINEKRSKQLAISTKEYLYNGYIQRIRRLVNFYWQQNLDNLTNVRLAKSSYVTKVNVILDSEGALEYIEVTGESGSDELDDAVVRAFKLAGPYPNPPEGLVEKDGRVYLPDFDFTVNVGVARASYQGIDPRAGVQFPGILKSPR